MVIIVTVHVLAFIKANGQNLPVRRSSARQVRIQTKPEIQKQIQRVGNRESAGAQGVDLDSRVEIMATNGTAFPRLCLLAISQLCNILSRPLLLL